MENFKSYRRQIDEIRGNADNVLYKDCSYEDALKAVKKYIQEKKLKNDDVGYVDENTKEYLNRKLIKYREYVNEAYMQLKIRVDDYEQDEFVREALSDIAGYSILDDAFADPEITDIFVNTENEIFVEKSGQTIPYWKKFRSEAHYLDIVERFMQDAGKELNTGSKKIVNFELFGDRGAAISDMIATKQISLTFRKHGYSVVTRDDLIEKGVMTEEIADFIGIMLRGELNMMYCGLTGSGKTTTIQSLLNYYIQDKRVLCIEDTQELELSNPNTLQLVSFKGKTEDESVSLGTLIETALRLKPRTIVCGEVRGKEALAVVEAGETGHSTITTMHGSEPINIINRFTTKYLMAMPSLGIDVVERIVGSSVDYICVQDNIPNLGRRVTNISEISYDFDKRRVDIKPIYKFDFKTNSFVKLNTISEDKIETMFRRGVRPEEVTRWI